MFAVVKWATTPAQSGVLSLHRKYEAAEAKAEKDRRKLLAYGYAGNVWVQEVEPHRSR